MLFEVIGAKGLLPHAFYPAARFVSIECHGPGPPLACFSAAECKTGVKLEEPKLGCAETLHPLATA